MDSPETVILTVPDASVLTEALIGLFPIRIEEFARLSKIGATSIVAVDNAKRMDITRIVAAATGILGYLTILIVICWAIGSFILQQP